MTEKLYEVMAQEEALWEYMDKKLRIGTLIMLVKMLAHSICIGIGLCWRSNNETVIANYFGD